MEAREITAEYRLAHWANIIQECRDSGELVEDFCLRKGISKHKYYYWQQKVRKAAGKQLSKFEAKTTEVAVRGFAEVKVAGSSVSYSTVDANQICIETGYCRLTAGSGYPADAIVTLLREVIKP